MCSFQETERYRILQGHYFKKWVYGEDTSLTHFVQRLCEAQIIRIECKLTGFVYTVHRSYLKI